MTRKLGLTLVLFALCTGVASAQGRRLEGDLSVTPVRGSVYFLVMEPAGNVGVSAGPDGAFIIDDQFAPMVPRLTAAVGKLSEKPIRYVLNTHWHPDHAGGNEGFGREGYVIVAHDNVRTRLSAEQFSKYSQRTTPAAPPAAWPVITFSKSMTFHFNGDAIRVEHIPNAHTDGDAIYHFAKADVVHTGDVFVRYGYPFIDLASGGSLAGMIAGQDRLLEIIGPKTIVIPGHGQLAERKDVEAFRAFLIDVRERIRKQLKAGKTADEIVAAKPLADLDAKWGNGFIKADQFVKTVVESEKGS